MGTLRAQAWVWVGNVLTWVTIYAYTHTLISIGVRLE